MVAPSATPAMAIGDRRGGELRFPNRTGTRTNSRNRLMPSITMVVPGDMADRLRELAGYDVESAGVLLVRRVECDGGDVRLLARHFIEVPAEAYERREAQQMV